MSDSLGLDIRRRLSLYLKGGMSLKEFGEWFVPATWDVDRSGDQAAIDMTYEIILRLAEYSNGDCLEAQLKDLLRPLVATPMPSAARA